MESKYDYDAAVIGGGPAGMMAAIESARNGLRVVLIEKNKQLGKKLLLTGNGRCNLTNAEFNLRELVKSYNNGEFLFHAFSVFGPKETINFFEKLGIEIKMEGNPPSHKATAWQSKRVFPKSDDAGEILNALEGYLEKNKVNILYNSEVIDIDFKNKKINKLVLKAKPDSAEGFVVARNYILCTGGKSYSKTGSNGFGYKLAEKLGHSIIKPMPALVPIKLSAQGGPASGWKDLQGINLKNIKINIFCNGKKKFSKDGEILFTHYGISGPAVLDISGKIGDLLEKSEVKIFIDLFPLLNSQEVLKSFEELLKKYPKQAIKNILSEFVPERLAEVLLKITETNVGKPFGELRAGNMSKIEKEKIVKILKNIEVVVEDVLGFENAMVTRGGISLEEIDHKTMKSKIIENLFFAGEIIDVDGKTGGFNLQACWSTGYLAGKSVTKLPLPQLFVL